MGAICTLCNQDMTVSDGCVMHAYTFQGKPIEAALKYLPLNHGDKCHDCGAKPGHFHHPGCDMERCPWCGGQMITCDHSDVGILQFKKEEPS